MRSRSGTKKAIKVGTLLYDTKDGNEVVIHLPVVLLAGLTCRYQIPHFHELCQFPAPDAGVPFEVQVLKTIVVRLSILNQQTLPAIFPSVTVTGECSCCVSHMNLFSDPSSRFIVNGVRAQATRSMKVAGGICVRPDQ